MNSYGCFEAPTRDAIKYVRSEFKGYYVKVPVCSVRRICGVCGKEFWAWPDTFDWVCAKCQAQGVGP